MTTNALLLAAFGGVLLMLLAALPAWAISQPVRAARIRGTSPGRMVLWWVVASAPWLIAWLTVVIPERVDIPEFTTGEIAALVAATLAAYALFVALPVAVITATVIWLGGRRRPPPPAAGRDASAAGGARGP